MLRASLNMKIKNNRLGKSLDELTPSDFKSLALAYCQQVKKTRFWKHMVIIINIFNISEINKQQHEYFCAMDI